MADQSIAKNFDFKTISEFGGYVSSRDKTNLTANTVVVGSQNVYKTDSGIWEVRPGQKRLGEANSALSAITSEYVWNTSWGTTLPLVVSDSNLYVVYGTSSTWYSLLSGLTETRYVFDKWYDATQAKDRLLFVNGTSDLFNWSGGISTIASGNFSAGQVAQLSNIPTAAGANYTVGDILTITTGGTLCTARVDSVGTGTVLTVSVPEGGRGYSVGDVLTLGGGDFGTGCTVTVASLGSVSYGDIATVTLTTGGLGYFAGGYYRPTGGSGNSAFISTSTVSTGGSVTGVTLLTPGSGYTTGTGKATSGGTGTGCTLNIVTIDTGSILKLDTDTSFIEDGFSTSGSIKIGGNTFTYNYAVGNYLVGVSPDPSSVVSGTVGLQTVTTYSNFLPNNAKSDFIKVINNRVYSGSYNSRRINISSSIDFTNYAVPATTTPGSPNLLILDSNAKGIGVRQGNPHIGFGTSSWMIVTYPTHTNSAGVLVEQITPDVKPVSKLAAPYAHEFIDTVGDTLVYLAQDQQVRTFGDFANLFTPKYPSLSQNIKTELEGEVFTGGALKCIGDMTYLTAPNTGKVYIYEVRESPDSQGNIVAERLWFAPFVWGITRVDTFNGLIYGFSSSNPQIYQLWDTNQWYDDSPSDEELPYSCILAFAYRTTSNRVDLQQFDKTYSEGYMSLGTPLNLQINYNYEGSTNQISTTVNSVELPAYTFAPSVSSLGDETLGESPMGDELVESDVFLPKFKVINSLSEINCFEWQPIYYSDSANARWGILATGANARLASEQPVYIINKRRT